MSRRIKVKAVWRKEPDIRLYALALIALARQLQAEERVAEAQASSPDERREAAGD